MLHVREIMDKLFKQSVIRIHVYYMEVLLGSWQAFRETVE